MTNYTAAAATCALLLLCSRQAQAQPHEQRYATMTLPLCADPGGSKRADVILGAPLTVLERKGEWAHVTLDGWVRDSMLGGKPLIQDGRAANAEQPKSELVVSSFATKALEGDKETKKRVQLTLNLKNSGSRRLAHGKRCWS